MKESNTSAEEAKRHIERGEIAEAIQHMLAHTSGTNLYQKISLLGLQSRLSRWNNLLRTGQIDHPAYDKQVNRISMSLLAFVHQKGGALAWFFNLIPLLSLLFLALAILSMIQNFEGIKTGQPTLGGNQLRYPILKIGDKPEDYSFYFETPDTTSFALAPHMAIKRKDGSIPDMMITTQGNLAEAQEINAKLEYRGRYELIIPFQSKKALKEETPLLVKKINGEQSTIHDYPLRWSDYFINRDTRIVYVLAFIASIMLFFFLRFIKN